jgi:hypothetical protein
MPLLAALRLLLVGKQLFDSFSTEVKIAVTPSEIAEITEKYQSKFTELEPMVQTLLAQARVIKSPKGRPEDSPAYLDSMAGDIFCQCMLVLTTIYGEPILDIISPFINPRGNDIIQDHVKNSHEDAGRIAAVIIAALTNRAYLPYQSQFIAAICTSSAHLLQNRSDKKFDIFVIDGVRKAYPNVKKLYSQSQGEGEQDTFAGWEKFMAELAQWVTPTVDTVTTLDLNDPEVLARVMSNTIADNPRLFIRNFITPV